MGYTIAEEQCQKYLTCKFLFGGKSQISLLFRLDKVIQESQETMTEGKNNQPDDGFRHKMITYGNQNGRQNHEQSAHGRCTGLGTMRFRTFGTD